MLLNLPFQNVMMGFAESPLIQAQQILALSPTSPSPSQAPPRSPSVGPFIMPLHQIPEQAMQPNLPNSGDNMITISSKDK